MKKNSLLIFILFFTVAVSAMELSKNVSENFDWNKIDATLDRISVMRFSDTKEIGKNFAKSALALKKDLGKLEDSLSENCNFLDKETKLLKKLHYCAPRWKNQVEEIKRRLVIENTIESEVKVGRHDLFARLFIEIPLGFGIPAYIILYTGYTGPLDLVALGAGFLYSALAWRDVASLAYLDDLAVKNTAIKNHISVEFGQIEKIFDDLSKKIKNRDQIKRILLMIRCFNP